jgi:alpha-beta hydrolase superfamily lysophospholipase
MKLTYGIGNIRDESYLAFLDMLVFNLPDPEKINTNITDITDITDILVMGAEDDAIFYPDEVEATAAACHTTPVFFSKMAHDMMLEPDWLAVADHIIEWLTQQKL